MICAWRNGWYADWVDCGGGGARWGGSRRMMMRFFFLKRYNFPDSCEELNF